MGILAGITSFFGFVGGNIQVISYAIIAIILAAILWQGYNLVRSDAQKDIIIQDYKKNEQTYQQAIADKNAQIALQQALADMSNQAINDRDVKIKNLEDTYNTIVNANLGKDINDQAAASLKELIRELIAKEGK